MHDTPIPGIPTRYKGRQYRSRLEARWACFFDLLGWHYEYEPCDFEGWIPDFVLCEADTVFVEVKPVTTFPREVAAKIDATSCGYEALIVGLTLQTDVEGDLDHAYPCVGWLREVAGPQIEAYPVQGAEWAWASAPYGVWSPLTPSQPPRVGFCHELFSFRDRITGQYDGGRWGERLLDIPHLWQLWAQAGNEVQWIARTTLQTHLQQGFYPLRTTL
jgi:hypothetical protein